MSGESSNGVVCVAGGQFEGKGENYKHDQREKEENTLPYVPFDRASHF